jgi:hypothetical protein
MYNKQNQSFIVTDDIKQGYEVVAEATFIRSRFQVGWDKLNIKTMDTHNPLLQCYAAGILEGTLTHEEINYYFNNARVFFMGEEDSMREIKDFYRRIDANIQAKIKNIESIKASLSDYEFLRWSYIACLHAQINGLHIGFNNNSSTSRDLFDFYFLNSEGNFGDLKSFMAVSKMDIKDPSKFSTNENLKIIYKTDNIEQIWKDLINNGHCSALVKLIKDANGKYDLLGGHNTWTEYCEMLRTLKYIEWAFEGTESNVLGMKPRTVSFSSYPGVLFSGDDFYLNNSNVALLQTTLSVINKFAYKDLINVDNYVPEFMRLMICNFMSNTGKQWVDNYKSWKDHMYITQWLVLDYDVLNQINSGKQASGLLHIIEEVPGKIFSDDLTGKLMTDTYFGSFNIAYFKQSHQILGMDNFNVDFTSTQLDPRQYIYNKLQDNVKDTISFRDVLQYNGYGKKTELVPNDPSYSDPSNGISSRADLLGNGNYHGGVDFKVKEILILDCE